LDKSPFTLDADAAASKSASDHTRASNHAVTDALPFSNRRSFEDAARGFIATIDPLTIHREGSRRPVYDLSGLDFLAGSPPDTVNPSLWRQAQLPLEVGFCERLPFFADAKMIDVYDD